MTCPASHVTEDVLHEHEEVSDRAMMRALPEEERIKIQQQVQMFRIEKAKLDREVAKWDESGNDIIIIAKQMCMIMMEMTDFTRSRRRIVINVKNLQQFVYLLKWQNRLLLGRLFDRVDLIKPV